MSLRPHIVLSSLVLTALCRAGEPPEGWRDCLAGQPLEVRAEGTERKTVTLCDAASAGFTLEVEARWSPVKLRGKGGFDLAVGPHGVGSGGYRLAVGQGPWRAVECRGPRIPERLWRVLRLTVGAGGVEYRLGGELVARMPDGVAMGGAVRLAVAPGTQVSVRRCWLRTAGAEPTAGAMRLVYPAEGFDGPGWPVTDKEAKGSRSLRVLGRGREAWLVRGQDGTVPADGEYVAWFALRGVSGSGTVWLEAARSGVGPLAAETLRVEELPRERYARVPVRFACAAGQPLEFRVAASGGWFRIDDVMVTPASDGLVAPGALRSGPQARQAPRLTAAWAAEPPAAGGGLSVTRLSRRLGTGGWYEFRATWRQSQAEWLEGVAVDLWVACRDRWGRISVFDLGQAHGRVARGDHVTSAWLGPEAVRRYGSPVALFAQASREGRAAARRWRKWGIPVEDKWIVGAAVVGRLRAERPTE